MNKKTAKIKVGLLCGGPSLERGISLNSARSVMDHLDATDIEIVPIYINLKKEAYKISKAQLYSNTPSDFDFKLQQTATALTQKSLIALLKKVDIVFPAMHGQFGEDGGIQSLLEKHAIPFVGSGSEACKKGFDKHIANTFIGEHGFFTLPSVVLKIYQNDHKRILTKFFTENKIKRAVVKPASGGSSIGVFSVTSPEEALEKSQMLFSKRMDTRVVVEPFAEGVEFTMIILENRFGLPVALPPTEIETDYTENQIFDFRRKYLPSRQVVWHCPPRFDRETIDRMQAQAEQLFALFGMHDVGRFDGWVLPDGNIWFCDFNPVSGMEQNSFLFQQASRIGMTHSDILRHVTEISCKRQGVQFPKRKKEKVNTRKRVNIVMGGDNSERQVSLMSGTNVWLKMRSSKLYEPQPYLLVGDNTVWHVPYHLCLNHTVEEIAENCEAYQTAKEKLHDFEKRARLRLGLNGEKNEKEFFEPKKMSLTALIRESEYLFIALHGGEGENGVLQKKLEKGKVKYNGPSSSVSKLCMDKWDTASAVNSLDLEGVSSIPGKVMQVKKMCAWTDEKRKVFWKETRKELSADALIVKPRDDGCTTGIASLRSSNDLKKYLKLIEQKKPYIPKDTFKGQGEIIEMPIETPKELLFERFIETDTLRVKANKLKHQRKTGWIEITVGVLERGGKIHALNPSITVAEGDVLTVEEKFQGGTGVNITPPPSSIIKRNDLKKIRERITLLAKKIGITGYSRIDAFVNSTNGDLLIIEVNTLPALTPSTVLYHQGLAEKPVMYPRKLLETVIKSKKY